MEEDGYFEVEAQRKKRKISEPWSTEEDSKLVGIMTRPAKERDMTWPEIAKLIGRRTADQCCQRWFRVLSPDIKKTPWTREEDMILHRRVRFYGPKQWSYISKGIKGRTDTQCRHRWNHLMKHRRHMDGDWFIIPEPRGSTADGHDHGNHSNSNSLGEDHAGELGDLGDEDHSPAPSELDEANNLRCQFAAVPLTLPMMPLSAAAAAAGATAAAKPVQPPTFVLPPPQLHFPFHYATTAQPAGAAPAVDKVPQSLTRTVTAASLLEVADPKRARLELPRPLLAAASLVLSPSSASESLGGVADTSARVQIKNLLN